MGKAWYKNLHEEEQKSLVLLVQSIAERISTGEFSLEVALYGMIDYGFKLGENYQLTQENKNLNDLLEGIDFSDL